jgi:16S rRNA (guanine527-N7)-methyltransferase
VETTRIAELLEPYFVQGAADVGGKSREFPAQNQLINISTYIDMLLKWNARINLTAVRQPEEMVRRHFGESLFAAQYLFPAGAQPESVRVFDVGSGAGFPGLPVKLWSPQIQLTLIESNQKKVAFLREVVRTLTLTSVDVFAGRAEDCPGTAGVVTLRAVERFESALPVAARLVAAGGRLALLIGEAQREHARELAPEFGWNEAVHVPESLNRALLVGRRKLVGDESSW